MERGERRRWLVTHSAPASAGLCDARAVTNGSPGAEDSDAAVTWPAFLPADATLPATRGLHGMCLSASPSQNNRLASSHLA